MDTIPIEIILQDAEDPVVPTPEPETDITVPDTGAESMGSDNSFSTSSMIGIIIPAILLILAITTIFALLVHKHHKKQNKEANISKKEKLATATGSTIAMLLTTVLISNLIIPTTKAASDNEGLITEDKITIVATREEDSDTIIATVKDTSYATANFDFGYKVTASMAEGSTSANLYLDGDKTSEYYFSPVEDGELVDNTWGYSLEQPSEASSYLSIPIFAKPTTMTKEIAKNAQDKAVDIYYTIKVDKDMPNGIYKGELEYTLSSAIEYMQDFSTLTPAEKTAALARMPEGKQYILKDIRDNKPYYISKLADGKVWMTQNLDLDINENTTYTHADTDLGWSDPNNLNPNAKWKPDEGHSTIRFTGNIVSGWVNSSTAPYSADPDELYVYSSSAANDDFRYTSLETCKAKHPDCSKHNHVGNYYNWSSAVASNDSSNMTEYNINAPDSICPAGWSLPEGLTSWDNPYNDMSYLAISYPDTITGPVWGCGHGCSIYEYSPEGFNNIRSAPLWFVRSGGIEVRYGTSNAALYEDASVGYYWSGTMISSYALRLRFNNEELRPDDTYGRHQGYSIRCLTK